MIGYPHPSKSSLAYAEALALALSFPSLCPALLRRLLLDEVLRLLLQRATRHTPWHLGYMRVCVCLFALLVLKYIHMQVLMGAGISAVAFKARELLTCFTRC